VLHLLSPLILAVAVITTKVDSTDLRKEALMSALQKGGYTVILRHARTDRSFQEQVNPMPTARSAQRNLSDDGVRDAALMGAVFRKYGIAFSEILSSPMARAVETAEMAGGKPTTTMALRVIPSTAEQAALVKAAPKRGTNRLLVTHHFVIETHVPGIRPGDVGESEAAVVHHEADGSIVLVGRITLGDWQALANPYGATSTAQPGTSLAKPAAELAPPGAAAPQGSFVHGSGPPPTVAPSIPSGVVATIPDTHAGSLARQYIAAFNTGDPDRMRAFIETSFAPDPSRPLDERLKSYAKLFADLGALSVSAIERSEPTELIANVTSKRGVIRLTVRSSVAQPMRATSISFAIPEGTPR
jgi:phosphohistidine phosphatase SixA